MEVATMSLRNSCRQMLTIRRIFVLVWLLFLYAGSSRADSWTVGPSMPTARYSLAVAAGLDGRIFAIGGAAEYSPVRRSSYFQTVEAYNPTSQTWTAVAPMPTARGGLAAATARDGRIFAVGGLVDPNTQVVSTVEIYSPLDNSWAVGPSMLTPRYGPCAAAGFDGKIYVFGGWTGDAFYGHPVNSVEAFDQSAGIWTYKANMPTARDHSAAALGPDGQIYGLV